MCLFEFFDGVVGVNLRSGQVGVAQQFFDGVQVGTPVEQMRGVGVAQHVGAFLGKCRDGREVPFHRALNENRVGGFVGVGQDKAIRTFFGRTDSKVCLLYTSRCV